MVSYFVDARTIRRHYLHTSHSDLSFSPYWTLNIK